MKRNEGRDPFPPAPQPEAFLPSVTADDPRRPILHAVSFDIQTALRQVAQNHTTWVIAHRLSTIVDADQTLVMEQGRIIERGSHRELLDVGGPMRACGPCYVRFQPGAVIRTNSTVDPDRPCLRRFSQKLGFGHGGDRACWT